MECPFNAGSQETSGYTVDTMLMVSAVVFATIFMASLWLAVLKLCKKFRNQMLNFVPHLGSLSCSKPGQLIDELAPDLSLVDQHDHCQNHNKQKLQIEVLISLGIKVSTNAPASTSACSNGLRWMTCNSDGGCVTTTISGSKNGDLVICNGEPFVEGMAINVVIPNFTKRELLQNGKPYLILTLDVSRFGNDHIKIKAKSRDLRVYIDHVEQLENGFNLKQMFVIPYVLPEDDLKRKVASYLTDCGMLFIEVPLKSTIFLTQFNEPHVTITEVSVDSTSQLSEAIGDDTNVCTGYTIEEPSSSNG